MADAGPVAILTAIPEELAGIRRAVPQSGKVVLGCTGDGPRRAAAGAATFLERHKPSALIGAGLAGALTPGLSVGELVASRRVRFEVGDVATPDEDGYIMFRLTPRSPALRADAPISCEWRPGDVW